MSGNTVDTMSMETESFVQVDESVTSETATALSLLVTPRHSVIGTASTLTNTQVCITVKAGELPDDGKRAPIDLIVALDCSGSMSGRKLELCKTTLERIIRFLTPNDRFGLVSFASQANIEIPARKMTTESKNQALAKVQSLHTRDMTNMSAAIGLAAQEMKLITDPNEVRAIFLLTDGHANEGITDADGMVQLTKNCLASDVSLDQVGGAIGNISSEPTSQSILGRLFNRHKNDDSKEDAPKSEVRDVPTSITTGTPITLHCFGYGSDHDSQLLSTLATSATPGGTYYFVENDKNVGEAFGDALGGVLSVVAQSAVVNITIPPDAANHGVKILDIFHDNKIERDDGSYSVTIGDFYAEESRDVVLNISVATHCEEVATPVPHLSVSLSYTDTLKKRPVRLGRLLSCFISRPTGSDLSEENEHVVAQWLRIDTANQMNAAQEFADRGDFAQARVVIQQAMEAIDAAPHNVRSHPLASHLVGDLAVAKGGLESSESYAVCSHAIRSNYVQHKMQRCEAGDTTSRNVYRSSMKTKMGKAFKSG